MFDNLLDSTQGSVSVGKVAGVQDLYPRVMVSVERCRCTRTPGIGRVCGVSKPDPEVVQLDRNRWGAGVQDEGFIAEDPSHLYDTVTTSIGC